MSYANQQWVHSQIDLATMRRSVREVSPEPQRILEQVKSARSSVSTVSVEKYRVPYTTLSLAFLIGFVVAFSYQWHSLWDYPEVYDFESIASDTLRLADRDDVLSRLTQQRKRQLASEVHYLANVIRTHGSKKMAIDPKNLAQSIVFEAKKANYDPLFVAAVIKSESTFNHRATSPVGAKGLMQIMPATGQFISKNVGFKWAGEQKLQDPQYNIKLGIAYLKYLDHSFRGNKELMLVAYNWGPYNVRKALKARSHMPSSSTHYARGIIGTHVRWKKDFDQKVQALRFGQSLESVV